MHKSSKLAKSVDRHSHRRVITQLALLANSRYVLQGMGVRKVSNPKSDLQGHSKALALVPFDRPHTIYY